MAASDERPDAERVRTVVVSGDVTVDWNLARESLSSVSPEPAGGRASWRGGAALLADLITSIAATLEPQGGQVRVSAVDAPTEPVPPGDDDRNHSYSVWSQFAAERGAKVDKVWRVVSALGVDRSLTDDAVRAEWTRLADALARADVIVLDDAALGFRDLSDGDLWRRVAAERHPWIVLKQARPIAQGPLWEHVLAAAADRLIVVLAIDDLRGREIQVSRALSWERTAQELVWELINKPDVNVLSRIAHTVVSFGPTSAVLVSGSSATNGHPRCTLFFDPELVEGVWEDEHAGGIMGGTDCLTAALVRELLLDPDVPELGRGIGAGVAAARSLHLNGYEERGRGRLGLGFPVAAVVAEMSAGREPLQSVAVPEPSDGEYWTILEARCTGNLTAKAADIARQGPKRALVGVPLGRFGHLVTADRSEIEAFRSIAGLIREYAHDPSSGPLSVGVFGPPGSGKSFGVKQVAAAVAGKQVSKPLEFNLAQLRSPDELADAFHLVRDKALAGEIPLVFWDEFDTALDGVPLGWLRYFLAPMQDGEFRQGQLSHPIGSSIFVFAGGTCARVEDFGKGLPDEVFRQAKGPDFVSRLKGFVNVLGPNAQNDADPYYVIRRAILLRSILERKVPQLFDGDELRIDSGVLRAFLETTEFRHGARSLEAVVATSHLAHLSSFERSSLPAAAQLALHVDAQDFLALVQRPDLSGPLLERLARAAHRVYEKALPDGSTTASVDYDDLPPYKQDENRDNVRDIPAKLALVDCTMVPASTGAMPTELTSDEVEVLAREEHERWMRDLGPGWRYGTPTDKTRKIHAAYVSWDELPADERDKDRNLVSEIRAILHEAGYVLVRVGAPEQAPS